MRELTIRTEDGSKGRSFRAALLSYVVAPGLWEKGDHKNVRPIWATIACGEGDSGPFIANLRRGEQASLLGNGSKAETFECLRSVGYEFVPQRYPEGTVWTVYLPELYRIDPGMVDPAGVKFAMLPDPGWLPPVDEQAAQKLAAKYWEKVWIDQEEADANRLERMRYVTRVAPLFCAYLDRRTRCPLIPERRFYSLVLGEALAKHIAEMSSEGRYGRATYKEFDVEDVGLLPGLKVNVTHEALEPFLAECVAEYEREWR